MTTWLVLIRTIIKEFRGTEKCIEDKEELNGFYCRLMTPYTLYTLISRAHQRVWVPRCHQSAVVPLNVVNMTNNELCDSYSRRTNE
jgi:hypothetical protein